MDTTSQIVVISSELEHRRALVEVLNREGWDTVCASTVSQCEELLATDNVSVVFCDRRLPDGTYRDVLRINRSMDRNIPLVVTSRLADWKEYLEVLHDGAFELIASPCAPTDAVWVTLRAQHEHQKRAPFVDRSKARVVAVGAATCLYHCT